MSNDTAIKRFTYDWLIRFTELHPFQPYDSDKNPVGAFNPLMSQYAAISPTFTNLMTRHMPYLFYGSELHVRNRKIIKSVGLPLVQQNFVLPTTRKYSIYICAACHITDLTPDLFTWFKDNQIIFYGEHLYMTSHGATVVNQLPPNTPISKLQKLHQNQMFCFGARFAITPLTEPVAFSEIFPFIVNYKDINLYTPVIYGTSFTDIARNYRFSPYRYWSYAQDMTDNVMLEMVDHFLSMPNRAIYLEMTFHESKPHSLNKIVVDKVVSAGIQKRYCATSKTPFDKIRLFISKETGVFDCFFIPTVLEQSFLYPL